MEGSTSKVVLLVMGWALVVVIAEAQYLPSCANQLSPCAAYLNSTSPPNICCNPIKVIVSTEKTCFCQLALAPSILQSFGINTTQALQLVQLCGVNFDPTSCKASSPVGQPPSSEQPPATPGGDEGGAGRVTFTGLSFFLLFWALVWFN